MTEVVYAISAAE
jgi:predicted GIY-YIG superfamily endonuclease